MLKSEGRNQLILGTGRSAKYETDLWQGRLWMRQAKDHQFLEYPLNNYCCARYVIRFFLVKIPHNTPRPSTIGTKF